MLNIRNCCLVTGRAERLAGIPRTLVNPSGQNRKSIDDIEAELRDVFERLPCRNIKRIKVFMVPNTGFRDDGHDRFIRFGDYVWDIGLGLEVLDGAYSVKRSSAGFKSGIAIAGYKGVEQDLAGNADTKSREIR